MRHGTTTLYVTGQDNLGEVVAWLTHRNDSVQIHTMARFRLSRRREFSYFLLYYTMLCGCEGKSQRQQCSIKAEHVERRSVYNALLWITPQTRGHGEQHIFHATLLLARGPCRACPL